MQESNNNQEPSIGPTQPFINPDIDQVKATWEMLVAFKSAILNNQWRGADTQAVAMGIQMISMLEGQYRSQYEHLKTAQKQAKDKAKEEILKAGGKVNEPNPDLSVA